MKTARLIVLVLVLGLLTLAPLASAAPYASPCAPGAAYDPACDANQDGQITVADIQLTAGHWNQNGAFVSDNNHTHLGQTWTGSNNPLTIDGTFGTGNRAALVLSNSYSSGHGLRVNSAGYYGVFVSSAGVDGLFVNSAGDDGVNIVAAADDGVYVATAGAPSAQISSSNKNGFEVAGAEGSGLYVGQADGSGVYVAASGWGVTVASASGYGVYVGSTDDDGLLINSAGERGITVTGAADDGVFVRRAGAPSVQTASDAVNGFEVAGAQGNGLYIGQADMDGIFIDSAASIGVNVHSAGADGVYVQTAGTPSAVTPSTDKNGFEVAGAQGNGLYVGQTDQDGVHVERAGVPSINATSLSKNGFEVSGAQGMGLFVGRADLSGAYVNSAGNDGLWVGTAEWNGVNVYAAYQDGVHVTNAGDEGVYANTIQTNHEWGMYTPDKIYAGSTLASGGPLMLVAQSGDANNLETGDVVMVGGTGAVVDEGEAPPPLVRRAEAGAPAVMGVVYRRVVMEEEVQQINDAGVEQQVSLHVHGADGPIGPGDYLFVVVLGPAQIKVAGGDGLTPGDLLTAGGAGRAAKATPIKVGETTFYAPGTVIGQAMGALEPAQGDGLIWALVMPG
jgi:hypothetical protein